MEGADNKDNVLRRKFLETGLTAAAGVALGLAAGNLLEQPADDASPAETVKMLMADGTLVEVDKRRLPPMCGKRVAVSNKVLQEWMEKDGRK